MTIENKLTALFRVDCPDTVELGEFHLNMIDDRQRFGALKAHVAVCPHCTQELAQLEAYLTDLRPEVEYTPVERLKVFIARLLPEGGAAGAGALQPAFALRGDERAPLMLEAGETQIALEIEPVAGRPSIFSLTGMVMGTAAAGMRAALWPQEGAPVEPTAAGIIDDIGNFILTDIPAGTYELILRGADSEIRIPELELS